MQRAIDFLRHWFSAKTRHGTHSPFVYDVIEKCIYRSTPQPTKAVSEHFNQLKKASGTISGKDFGNGGVMTSRSVAHYANTSSLMDFQARLLHRLVAHFKPQSILELGTNIGKSSAYMATANNTATVLTIDGNEGLSEFARSQHQNLSIENIQFLSSTFDHFFTANSRNFDFVFVDGNHHYKPTMTYFKALKPVIKSGGCIVFHDIYWSKGMKQAWSEIKKDQDVSISLDLFFFGIVWFGKNQAKEDFKVRFPLNPIFLLF